jgi:hypothetical protein
MDKRKRGKDANRIDTPNNLVHGKGSEIDSWLMQGRRKTLAEITSEAEANLKRKGGKNA